MKFTGNLFKVKLKLKTQLFFVLVALSIIPMIVVGIFTYISTMNNIRTEKERTLKAYSEGIVSSLDSQLKGTGSYLRGLSNNADLIATLKDYNEKGKTDNTIRYYSIMMSLGNVIINSEKLYETASITTTDGKVAMDGSKQSDKYIGKAFYNMKDFDAIRKTNDIFIGNPFKSTATGKYVLPVSRQVKSTEGFMGIITIMVDMEKLMAGLEGINFGKTSRIVILNQGNIILYHNDPGKIGNVNEDNTLGTILKENEKNSGFLIYHENKSENVLYYTKSGESGWLICSQIDEKEFTKPISEFRNFILLVAVLLIVLASFISFLYSGYVSRPLNKLMKSMQQVGKGDLNADIQFTSIIYETEELKKGFTDMVDNLRKLICEITGVSSNMSLLTSQMAGASQNSLAHGEQTAVAVEEIVKGIQGQAYDNEVMTQNVEQLAKSINTAKVLAEDISKTSAQVNASSEKGLGLVEILKTKSEENIRNTGLVEGVIKLLNKEIVEIDRIAQTINHIAQQTKLLSLNASIEAARAGDAGRGFSVVAEEIKGLSEKSSGEAGEINKIVGGVRNKARELSLSMESVIHSSGEQNGAVQDAGQAFVDIFNAIGDVNGKILNIASYLEGMVEEKNNIVGFVRHINEISEEVAANSTQVQGFTTGQMDMIREVNGHSDTLNNLADNLNQSISTFKL